MLPVCVKHYVGIFTNIQFQEHSENSSPTRAHQSPNRRYSDCSLCLEIFKILSVRSPNFGLFGVRANPTKRAVRPVRCSDCSLITNCSLCSVFGLFVLNLLFGVRWTLSPTYSMWHTFWPTSLQPNSIVNLTASEISWTHVLDFKEARFRNHHKVKNRV